EPPGAHPYVRAAPLHDGPVGDPAAVPADPPRDLPGLTVPRLVPRPEVRRPRLLRRDGKPRRALPDPAAQGQRPRGVGGEVEGGEGRRAGAARQVGPAGGEMAKPNVAERNGYACEAFAAAGWRHDVYRGGEGPAVLLLHEMPSFSWRTVRLANRIRDRGYRMVMPILVGGVRDAPGRGLRGAIGFASDFGSSLWRICVSREFVALIGGR